MLFCCSLEPCFGATIDRDSNIDIDEDDNDNDDEAKSEKIKHVP